jgi:hypothetical protein
MPVPFAVMFMAMTPVAVSTMGVAPTVIVVMMMAVFGMPLFVMMFSMMLFFPTFVMPRTFAVTLAIRKRGNRGERQGGGSDGG